MPYFCSPLKPKFTTDPSQRQYWGQLHGSSPGLTISHAAQQKLVIAITTDNLSAQRLIEEIRFYASNNLSIFHFPDWETLPYDPFSPHPDTISERLTTLYHLPNLEQGVLVLSISTLMHRLAPIDYIKTNTLLVNTGQRLNLDKFRLQLEKNSYNYVQQVMEHGEFTIKDSRIDLFPMGSEFPYRIDLLAEKVNKIHHFNPETQLSEKSITTIKLLPAHEFPLNDKVIADFRTRWFTELSDNPKISNIYQDVMKKLAPAGIEYYLPLFFEQTATLFDYLPANSLIISFDQVLETAEQFWQEVATRYEKLHNNPERPILAPNKLFLPANKIFATFRNYAHINLSATKTERSYGINFTTQALANLSVNARSSQPLSKVKTFINNKRVLIIAETLGRRESLLTLFKHNEIDLKLVNNWHDFITNEDLKLAITIGELEAGLFLNKGNLIENNGEQLTLFQQPIVVITEAQLFGERVVQRRLRTKSSTNIDTIVRDLTELSIDMAVVHEDHGVGRYRGLVSLEIEGLTAEFLLLEYANQDKLYVPISSLHLLNRFTGADLEHAPLHRLGSQKWEKAKQKAIKRVTDIAAELLDIYAKRAARTGHIFQFDAEEYEKFAQAFPFEETPDQQESITAVIGDMSSPQPMDRLICGDVGFGKTEVAMRATFIAVLADFQVAILVPTTLLAQQHYQTFQDRFANWPIRIEQLSRFSSRKQEKATIQGVANGQVDIVIGTHKLLNKTIKFKNLGLVVIDEEHRFGVKQKEQFKALRSEVDILTLTATPIPRSLNMAFSQLRDLSVIATPPMGRLAVKTFVLEWDNSAISEAIMRELKRGGQVYFLHNNVATIETIARKIMNLIPETQVRIAHGQMRKRELEQVMQDFYHRRFNVLVCTTIIENGIDVPTANTIIMNRADKLGLAQLYQLRGRVGRSHHLAYAYLILPPNEMMTEDAKKRIASIESLEGLGMGFHLATHDLEIRGAGELLGKEQSGHLQEIGYHLYTDLLERAVKAIKSGEQLEQSLSVGTEVNLHSSTLLPETYLADVHSRLVMYKRIANAPDVKTLDNIQVELIDRFGLLPEPAIALLATTELKLKATKLGITKIDFGEQGGLISFNEKPEIDLSQLIQLIQKNPINYKLTNTQKLQLLPKITGFTKRYQFIDDLLRKF